MNSVLRWLTKLAEDELNKAGLFPEKPEEDPIKRQAAIIAELSNKAQKRLTYKRLAKQLAYNQMLRQGQAGGFFYAPAHPTINKTVTREAKLPRVSESEYKKALLGLQKTGRISPQAVNQMRPGGKVGDAVRVTKFRQPDVPPVFSYREAPIRYKDNERNPDNKKVKGD